MSDPVEEQPNLEICAYYHDGQHRFDRDAMTAKELLLSDNAVVATSIVPPMKCACGVIKVPRDLW